MPAKRLLSDIVSLTPSNYDDFTPLPSASSTATGSARAARRAIPAPSTDQGLLVHDMLRKIHDDGVVPRRRRTSPTCSSAHGVDNDHVREMVDAPRATGARRATPTAPRTSSTLARFHRLPPPMFMATARIDAVWMHDGILDARDYKTGRLVRRARRRRSGRAGAGLRARRRGADAAGCGCGCATSTCSAEVDDDPEPWEPDAETSPRSRRSCAPRSSACGTNDEWHGVADASVCRTCRYRSICRDSAAPGEPAWPVLEHDRADAETPDR